MSGKEHKLLKIETSRTQAYLFKVPRLADMDGANALLGDLFRHKLPGSLQPFLVEPEIDKTLLQPLIQTQRKLSGTDPLICAEAANDGNEQWLTHFDNPSSCIQKGIIVRDGGRLWALVRADHIEDAKIAAATTIQKQCPGLGYTFTVSDMEKSEIVDHSTDNQCSDIVGLPCFQWADDGGDEPASKKIMRGEDQRYISHSTDIKIAAREVRGELWDVASLLYANNLIPKSDNFLDKTDFSDIAQSNYLAVIHMDGNSIGQRSEKVGKQNTMNSAPSFIEEQVAKEQFFLTMRSTTRSAVIFGLNQIFSQCPSLYRLIMLGGDDVLIVCRADKALPFANSVATQLQHGQHLDDDGPLTLGIGIVMAKPNLPFHRLHAMAEELASNAKAVAKTTNKALRSAIDWQITTSSRLDSIASHRKLWDQIHYTADAQQRCLVLTGKPYPVLASDNEPSLCALLDLAQMLTECFPIGSVEGDGVRTQLKRFLGEMRNGKRYSELKWSALPRRLHHFFKNQQVTGLDMPDKDANNLWVKVDTNCYRSWLADLIELYELPLIGASRKSLDNQIQEEVL